MTEKETMTLYELMIKANHYLIKGGELSSGQMNTAANQLLSGRSTSEQAQRYYIGVKFPDNSDKDGRKMYPVFYIPPYN